MAERKLQLVGKFGITCDQICFGPDAKGKNFSQPTCEYDAEGYVAGCFPVAECHAPGAPGRKSKLGRHRICVATSARIRELVEEDKVRLSSQ